MKRTPFRAQLDETLTVLHALEAQADAIERMIDLVGGAVLSGHTLFTCGNGGSATDALHLAEELTGRYRADRRPLPAICLNADSVAMTCIANDFGYDKVFARQLIALARPDDVLVCFSTSGDSPNILTALYAARECKVTSVALLGKDGGVARTLADCIIIAPSHNSARIQEAHTLLLHAICEDIENRMMHA